MTEKQTRKLVLVEDNPGDARLLREMLNKAGTYRCELVHVSSVSEAETHLAGHAVDVILLDPGLSDSQGLATVRRARAAAPLWPWWSSRIWTMRRWLLKPCRKARKTTS